MAENPGSINDTLQELREVIAFSDYIVQYDGDIVVYDDETVTYGRVLL